MTTHIVVLLGQSNANGSNTDFEPDGQDARDPRILTLPGSTHLTAEGQRLLGANYFAAYRELVA